MALLLLKLIKLQAVQNKSVEVISAAHSDINTSETEILREDATEDKLFSDDNSDQPSFSEVRMKRGMSISSMTDLDSAIMLSVFERK